MSGDRGPVPQESPPWRTYHLPRAAVLTAVAMWRHRVEVWEWVRPRRSRQCRLLAWLGGLALGMVALLAGVAPWVWGYDASPALLVGALLILCSAASAVLSRPGRLRGRPGRRAAAGVRVPAAAPGPAAVVLWRGRHRRLFRSGVPSAPVHPSASVLTTGGAPVHAGGAR